MNELEDKLNAILSDPAEMEKISRLAAQLMGGAESGPTEAGAAAAGLNLLSGGGDKTALLQALSPFLHPDRQRRLQKALRMAHMASLARTALETYGGGEDV